MSKNFGIANLLQTKFYPFMQMLEREPFPWQHKVILCILQ